MVQTRIIRTTFFRSGTMFVFNVEALQISYRSERLNFEGIKLCS